MTELINSTLTSNYAATGGGIYTGSTLTVKNCTIINNSAYSGSDFYNAYKWPVSLINTILYNSSAPYIYNENPDTNAMTIKNCAYSARSIYGSGNNDEINTVNISDWSASHSAEIISVDNVAQTVFKLKTGDTALIRGGTSENAPQLTSSVFYETLQPQASEQSNTAQAITLRKILIAAITLQKIRITAIILQKIQITAITLHQKIRITLITMCQLTTMINQHSRTIMLIHHQAAAEGAEAVTRLGLFTGF